jgi:chromosome segregation ATPase
MKDEEGGQEKFHFFGKLFSELREMEDQLNELEKIKAELQHEVGERQRIEEEFHKTKTSLEEQLTERGAELERMTKVLQDRVEENQRTVVEFHKTKTSLEEQLAERGAEIERIRAEHQSKLQEWRGIIDNLSFRLQNSKI